MSGNHSERISRIQEYLRKEGIDAALITYSRDIFYLTGISQPSFLIIRKDDFNLFIKSGFSFALDKVCIDRNKVEKERNLEKVVKRIFTNYKSLVIAISFDITSVEEYNEYKRILKNSRFTDLTPAILKIRQVKDIEEIDLIKKACRSVDMGHEAVLETLKPGIKELDLSVEVEKAHRLAGHEGTFFIRKPDFFMGTGPLSSGPDLFKLSGIVYSLTGCGLSSSVPVGASRRVIKQGDLVVVDIPTCVEGYHADMTRTYCAGKAKSGVKDLYKKLKDIFLETVNSIRPGNLCSDIYKKALKEAERKGAAEEFLSFGRGKSMLIGHGVGIEINEPPVIIKTSQEIIYENSVLAIEMHMLSEKHGVMKIEDTVLIGKDRNEFLTKSPGELFEITHF